VSAASAGAPDACPALESGFGSRHGRPIQIEAPSCAERYSSLLRCGKTRLLLRRAEARRPRGRGVNSDFWWTVARELRAPINASLSGTFGAARLTLPAHLNMSHNAAFMCEGPQCPARLT
jgi:hypothetical protein